MATASVTNTFVAAATASSAAVNTNFSDLVSFLNNSVVHVDGSKAMTGDLAMGSNKITGLATPTASTDASTKAYVDAEVGAIDASGDVTFENLDANSDVGTGSAQVAAGDHTHSTYMPKTGGTFTGDVVFDAGTSAGPTMQFDGMGSTDGMYGDANEIGVGFAGERVFSVHETGSSVVARATSGSQTRPLELIGNSMNDSAVAIRVQNASGTTDITFAQLKAIA